MNPVHFPASFLSNIKLGCVASNLGEGKLLQQTLQNQR